MRVRISVMVFLGIFVAVVPLLGFPLWIKTVLEGIFGITIAVISYFSSIVYCVHCKKAIPLNQNDMIPSSSPHPNNNHSHDEHELR
ncbi:MAG: hypothetical protein ACYC8S_00925 [Minisyncoccota bacterium]